jgi:hypothetical protein
MFLIVRSHATGKITIYAEYSTTPPPPQRWLGLKWTQAEIKLINPVRNETNHIMLRQLWSPHWRKVSVGDSMRGTLFYWNNQQMQLYTANFISVLSSLYMFRAAHTPIIRSTTVSTATGTIIGWRRLSRLLVPEGATHPREQVAVTTYANLWLYQWL